MIKSLLSVFLLFVMLAVVGAIWTQFIAARVASAYPPTGIFIPVSGGRLHLRDLGARDAPPEKTLVMIHGASGNHKALLVPLQPYLDAHYRIIAIDRPGHGHSDRPGGREMAAPARQASLINEALGAAGVSRAVVLAHSFGGAIATTLAMDYPERVAGLVLLGPATHPWPGGIAWYYGPASAPWLGWLFSHVMAVPGASLFMSAGLTEVFQPQAKPEDYEDSTALRLLLRPKNFMANAEDVAGLLGHVQQRAGHYSAIKVPVVILSGDQDKTVSTRIHSMALAKELPDAKLIVLPGIGHMVQNVEPAQVVQEIDRLSARLAR
jgi:pimeloyl-ACP methyl ester carboxylesterase